jgi:hypothetical protein
LITGVTNVGDVALSTPDDVSVPVMATPVEVRASIVVVPDWRLRLPELSAVWIIPPLPAVDAAIVLAMFYPMLFVLL